MKNSNRPPMPREHGAWVMLYASFAAGVVAVSNRPNWPAIGLAVLAITFAFLGQEPFRLAVRRRADVNDLRWLAIWSIGLAACAVALLAGYHRYALVVIGSAAVVFLGIQAILLRAATAKRADRTVAGELLAVLALTLPAAAAVIASDSHGVARATWIWIASSIFFGSGIVTVKMLLASTKYKKQWRPRLRFVVGRTQSVYHLMLIVAVAVGASYLDNAAAALLVWAFVPAIVRAFVMWVRLNGVLPPLKRVGILESVLAILFVVLAGNALRLASL